jgi:CheY-like chemotaxis protein
VAGIILRVLIIDDSATDRALAHEALSDIVLEDIERFVVETAAFGKDGIAKAMGGDYHAILLDYNLPDMNGLEVLRKLRADGNKTPVIAMTSAGGEKVAKEFIAAGARDYITKDQLSDVRLGVTIRNVVWMARLASRTTSAIFKEGWKDVPRPAGAVPPTGARPAPAGKPGEKR